MPVLEFRPGDTASMLLGVERIPDKTARLLKVLLVHCGSLPRGAS